jgi:hypothetical protein
MHPGAAVNLLKEQVRSLKGVDEDRRRRRLLDIAGIIESAQDKLETAEAEAAPSSPSRSHTLEEVLAVFDKWLHLPDRWPIYAVLGAMAANLLPGDPVWLGLIAPPSSAKTEILNSLTLLEPVTQASTLTVAALLSGVERKRRAKDAKGGLLREIGAHGVLLVKDYGSILAMRTEQRVELLAALREIYDGKFTRRIGAEGGRSLDWEGKMGLIFAATEAYDDHHAVIGGLGDRQLLFRLKNQDDGNEASFLKALDQSGGWRREIAQAVAGLFASIQLEPQTLTGSEKAELRHCAALTARLRAHVQRDRYSRTIDSVHAPEGLGRLAKALQQLMAGLLSIGVNRETALELIAEIALASAPPQRRRAFELLADTPQTTRELGLQIRLPTTTTERILYDLEAQNLCNRSRTLDEEGKEKGSGANTWTLSAVGRKLCRLRVKP